MDISAALEQDEVSYFHTIISILWWMSELGRIDKITEVSLLSSHVALPREGHLDAAVHVMAYVGQKYSSRLAYDHLYQEIDNRVLKKCDWSKFYWNAEETIPMNIPEP